MLLIEKELRPKGYWMFLMFAFYFLLLLDTERAAAQYKEQTFVYEIYHGDDVIGTLVAIMISEGKKKVYRIETHVNVKMVFSVKADVVVRNIFIDEVLSEAYAKRVINEGTKMNNSIIARGNGYQMITRDKDTSYHQGVIRNCVSQLYFQEPLNQKSVFSEAFLKYVPLLKSGGTYQLRLPDGKENQYTYVNGVCTSVNIETQLSRVKLKLVTSSTK